MLYILYVFQRKLRTILRRGRQSTRRLTRRLSMMGQFDMSFRRRLLASNSSLLSSFFPVIMTLKTCLCQRRRQRLQQRQRRRRRLHQLLKLCLATSASAAATALSATYSTRRSRTMQWTSNVATYAENNDFSVYFKNCACCCRSDAARRSACAGFAHSPRHVKFEKLFLFLFLFTQYYLLSCSP